MLGEPEEEQQGRGAAVEEVGGGRGDVREAAQGQRMQDLARRSLLGLWFLL